MLLNVATVDGMGLISANGAAGTKGGAGGRVALIVSLTSTFLGTFQAAGGLSNDGSAGGAGTVYVQVYGSSRILIDNGGRIGTPTPLYDSNVFCWHIGAERTVGDGLCGRGGIPGPHHCLLCK